MQTTGLITFNQNPHVNKILDDSSVWLSLKIIDVQNRSTFSKAFDKAFHAIFVDRKISFY